MYMCSDFEAAAERVRKNPLYKQHLCLRQVPVCHTVRIPDAATRGLNEHFIQLYFKSFRFDAEVVFHGKDADVTFPSLSGNCDTL